MARREPDAPRDTHPLKDGLKHNPFAALRGASATPREPAASATDGDAGARENTDGAKPSRERVTVRRERASRGGKTVTIVEGPGLEGRDLDALARGMARAFGTGARVEERSLVVQGDQRDRLAAWLTAHGFANVARGN